MFSVDTPGVIRGRCHRYSPRRGEHVPHAVVAVANHQPPPIPVDLIGERFDVGGDLSLQRRRQHLAGTIANNLIQQRTADTGDILWTYAIVQQ